MGYSAVQRVGECPIGSNMSHTVLVTPGALPKSAALATLFSLVFLKFAVFTASSGPLYLLLCPLTSCSCRADPGHGDALEMPSVFGVVCPRRRQSICANR